jgi:hypothetical protein
MGGNEMLMQAQTYLSLARKYEGEGKALESHLAREIAKLIADLYTITTWDKKNNSKTVN